MLALKIKVGVPSLRNKMFSRVTRAYPRDTFERSRDNGQHTHDIPPHLVHLRIIPHHDVKLHYLV